MVSCHGLDSGNLLGLRQSYVAQPSRNIESKTQLLLKQSRLSSMELVGTSFGLGSDTQQRFPDAQDCVFERFIARLACPKGDQTSNIF